MPGHVVHCTFDIAPTVTNEDARRLVGRKVYIPSRPAETGLPRSITELVGRVTGVNWTRLRRSCVVAVPRYSAFEKIIAPEGQWIMDIEKPPNGLNGILRLDWYALIEYGHEGEPWDDVYGHEGEPWDDVMYPLFPGCPGSP